MPKLIILLQEELFVDIVEVLLGGRYGTQMMKDNEELCGDAIKR